MPGDRLALLGPNGAGKSTCMKLLAGELTGLGGTRTESRDLQIGYFAQHHLEQLAADESPLENLRRAGGQRARRATEAELRDYLAVFGFRGDRVFETVEPFSGGEKARLVLALVAYQRPNLLLLDEPTNHLDLEMRQALSVALQEFSGAVVLVSHDRHLLNTVADELIVVHAGRAQPIDGDLDDYTRWLANGGSLRAINDGGSPRAENAAPGGGAEQRRQRRRDGAAQRGRLAPLRSTVARRSSSVSWLHRTCTCRRRGTGYARRWPGRPNCRSSVPGPRPPGSKPALGWKRRRARARIELNPIIAGAAFHRLTAAKTESE
jgi:ATP-binding cassette, subfamily F, member 3